MTFSVLMSKARPRVSYLSKRVAILAVDSLFGVAPHSDNDIRQSSLLPKEQQYYHDCRSFIEIKVTIFYKSRECTLRPSTLAGVSARRVGSGRSVPGPGWAGGAEQRSNGSRRACPEYAPSPRGKLKPIAAPPLCSRTHNIRTTECATNSAHHTCHQRQQPTPASLVSVRCYVVFRLIWCL